MNRPSASLALRLYAASHRGAERLTLPRDTEDAHAVLDDAPLGVYEGFRSFHHGCFLRLERHFDRAAASLAATGLGVLPARALLRRAIQQACDDWPGPDSRVRMDFLAEPASALGSDSRVLLVLANLPPMPDAVRAQGVRVGVARGMSRSRPLAKQAQWVVDRRAADNEYYENLLLDSQERVLECTSSNFFIVRDGQIFTAEEGVLEGVTRGMVLDLASEVGLPCTPRPISWSETRAADEAFLTSASRGVVPIVEIAGHPVGAGVAGPIWRQIHEASLRLIERELKPASTAP